MEVGEDGIRIVYNVQPCPFDSGPERGQREVARFFQRIKDATYGSEAAESLRKRLLKYEKKLFTFICHDGVPWNNNNAENAIKRFAYYRENTVGTMREEGLSDYLVLLSICQTCRYKGVSFLKFLLSREKDVDVFCEGRRVKRRMRPIEVYPEGFIPSHFRSEKLARFKKHRATSTTAPEREVEQPVQAADQFAAEASQ